MIRPHIAVPPHIPVPQPAPSPRVRVADPSWTRTRPRPGGGPDHPQRRSGTASQPSHATGSTSAP
ncbi:hypothetical protein [Streptomyces sp. NPDC001480]|uniref:hypothetical protein n=1 Tax=Streptomyces sp. NPDC001480 TaxID=3364577 RepID=UPI0036B085B1